MYLNYFDKMAIKHAFGFTPKLKPKKIVAQKTKTIKLNNTINFQTEEEWLDYMSNLMAKKN